MTGCEVWSKTWGETVPNRRHFLKATGALFATVGTSQAQMTVPDMSRPTETPLPGRKGGLVIPEGGPLRAFPKLANMARSPGEFSATITAAPVSIEFAPGKPTAALAYNGSIPGPLIEVTEGDRVSIEFANRVPGEDSTIHWHGLPVPADQDGNPMHPVASGANRTYAYALPDDSAGSFWYHPHPKEYTAEQVYRGLAGPFIVKPKIDPLPAIIGDTVLFISDPRLDADGSIPPNDEQDWANGREGDHILVNGQKRPVLTIPPGTSHRFRLYNASNARYLRLTFEGHAMTLIGKDGGYVSQPMKGLREFLLSPGERVEVVVDFQPMPGRISLRTLPYDRGSMGSARLSAADTPILTIELAGPVGAPIPLPSKLRDIERLREPIVRERIEFGERTPMRSGVMAFEGLINGKPFELGRVNLISRLNQVELWEVANPTDMDHPLHLHGTQFQVVEHEINGRVTAEPLLAWKDTVNVPRSGVVRFLVKQEMPGLRVYHCHILEHEERGMMGTLNVV